MDQTDLSGFGWLGKPGSINQDQRKWHVLRNGKIDTQIIGWKECSSFTSGDME